MYRFFLYLILTYIIYFIIKFVVNLLRLKNKSGAGNNITEKKPEQHIDKSKAVDADFEEIK